ncbi:hypothetical protein D3Z38_13900 [Clostridiales bacterium]|nr:hypothetical protein [Clostridiales bacterium]
MRKIKIPVGCSSFADIRKNGYYFIDKSALIKELLKTAASQVILITRPQRFGKTLAMSMLSEFFDICKGSKALFEGLHIAKEKETSKAWMNRYPTLFLAFRRVDGLGFADVYEMLRAVIAKAYKDNLYLLESERMNAFDKEIFARIAGKKVSKEEIKNALISLTQWMAAHYGRPVLLLVDEYDVPLAKASEKGYYTEMLDQSSQPKNFWENTSDNGIIRSFLERTSFHVKQKFEILLAGGMITESIVENLTYDVLKSSEENLWSLLYLTGYLTKAHQGELESNEPRPDKFALKIPNTEVRDIFKNSVKAWFCQKSMISDCRELFADLWTGDAEKLTKLLSDLLFDTIIYHDYRESFYHAFLVGLVSNAGYQVESNYENGLGRSDLVIKDPENRRAVVIEAKWTDEEAQLEAECRNALRQIEEKRYAQKVVRLGFQRVEKFGIAFFQKTCLMRNQQAD